MPRVALPAVRSGPRLTRRRLLANAGVVMACSVLAGPGLLPADEAWLSGVVIALIVFVPLRFLAVLLEVYLLRRGRQAGVVVSHVAGLVVGAMVGAMPSAPSATNGTAAASGWESDFSCIRSSRSSGSAWVPSWR